ncbi:MAG: hypothetical protein ACYCTE_16090, partial [Acidimicrobiales bacterium]
MPEELGDERDDVTFIAVVDRAWRVVARAIGTRCSFPRCTGMAVAICRRRVRAPGDVRGVFGRDYWYCPDHLYGHRIEGDVVVIDVAAGSPAAARGYVG